MAHVLHGVIVAQFLCTVVHNDVRQSMTSWQKRFCCWVLPWLYMRVSLVMDNRSYPSHSDWNNFNVEADISEYSDTDSEDDESNSREETWLTDE